MNEPTESPSRIVIVDDSPQNLKLLENMLQGKGYRVFAFPCGEMALRAIEKNPPHLILLDIGMPGMNGYEVCKKLKADEALAKIPVIFLSALNETNDKLNAFQAGGVDYVAKPFQFPEVDARVRTHLKMRKLQVAMERHNRNLRELVEAKIKEILETKEELSRAQMATIMALSKLAEARGDNTGPHIERTRTFCRILAEQLRKQEGLGETIDEAFLDNLVQAAPLHDIGMAPIPDAILRKPGALTPREFEVMKGHTTLGANTLRAIHAHHKHNAFISMGIEIAHAHHERWNGAGYPRGLAGADIPLSARIMAVADVYDALVSKRCYKPAFTHEKSREIIARDSGSHFDPVVVGAFLARETEFHNIRQTTVN